ncbi:MAG: DnaJ domain-containing protein [Alphaproteobacteria bacterium]|nr:DnaJ domain-containing protein [Alphaproteobacteria bacterium]
MNDPYRTLGVAKDADQATIRKAFKKLAREYHPDRNPTPEAEARFKEISGAYDVVGDEDKRKLWDEFGEISLKPGFNADQARAYGAGMGGFGGGGFGGGFPGGVFVQEGGDLGDIFGELFGKGGGPRRRAPRAVKGEDIRTDIRVDLLTAIRGGETSLRVTRPLSTGQYETTTLRVRVPAGVEDGQTIRLRGRGGGSPTGGPAGDVLLTVHVIPHPLLRREGQDLELEVPLTLSEAVLGGKIEVSTPSGRFNVKVPAGAQSGQRMRLRGKGLPAEQGEAAGDLYLVLRPTPPRSEDPELAELAQALDRFYDEDVRAGLNFPDPPGEA